MAKSDQERIFLSPPHMGGDELKFIQEAFETNYIAPLGPMVDAFESEFAAKVGLPHAVALASGTAAMHLVLRELGVGPGDTVVGSSLTFIGSVSPVTFLGAEPIFIDSDEASWTMDPDLLAESLADARKEGRMPKAVVPTDLYGQCADYDRLAVICGEHGVPLVIDAAEAMGARYGDRHAGAAGRAAIYSFNGNKMITTSGGGMLASDDGQLVERARFLATQARDDALHYEHSEIGYNYRMSSVVAAIGRGQLRVLDEHVEKRRANFEYYEKHLSSLPGVTFMPEAGYGRCSRWLTVMRVDPGAAGTERDKIIAALESRKIESRPVWKPMHMQPVFEGCRTYGGEVSEAFFGDGLCLPSGSNLDKPELELIVRSVAGCFE
ncbi:DegT/DnrJ/EryC1/StrS family aminotransferase [Verrucomicrobiota bacterium]